VESTETIAMLQCSVDAGIEDYNLLMEGNKSLLAERDEFRYRSSDLETEPSQVRSNAKMSVSDLETRIKSAKGHCMDAATAREKWLRVFEDELVGDLAEQHALYVCNTQSFGGMCSSTPKGEPSAMDYLHWLSAEVSCLPDMFAGVNENFVSIAVEGALLMAGDSVDLDALQTVTADSGAYILPTEQDVRRAVRVVSKKWWRSFIYNYVLAAI
jgi:hypothetical protein